LIINLEYSKLVTELEVDTGKNKINATIVERPFYDPKKAMAHS
jgi:glycine cleavage system aminomethyltransferase T|tara:strand:+ start:73 stop:201 length:129 start_codon:yes stop_codon:yes gene_type:complete